MASLIRDLREDPPGIIFGNCVTVQAAAILTGYNIQCMSRLALYSKLEAYLAKAQEAVDRRFGRRTESNKHRWQQKRVMGKDTWNAG